MNNSFKVTISTTKHLISDLLESALDDAISGEPMVVNSVEVKLSRIGSADVNVSDKAIFIQLPLRIDLKRAAGLFTVEGNGAIVLDLKVDYNLDGQMRLTTRTDLRDHEWVEKPVLEIGSLNIPVETLVDLVIKHHESIITAKVDANLKEHADLGKMLISGLENMESELNKQDLKGNKITLNLKEIRLMSPKSDDDQIVLEGELFPDIRVNSELASEAKPSFVWLEGFEKERQVRIPIHVPYTVLESQITELLSDVEVGGKRFDVISTDVSMESQMKILLNIAQPIKAEVTIEGLPVYNEIEEAIFIKNLEVDVNPSNIIYKLTAPFVNSFVEGKMKEFFPFSINKELNEAVEKFLPNELHTPAGKLEIQKEHVAVERIVFENDGIFAGMLLDNVHVKLKTTKAEG